VDGDYLRARVLLDRRFEVRSSHFQDLLAHSLDEPTSLVALGELRILSGPRPTNSCWKAIISSLMAASVLFCLRFMDVSLHLLIGTGAATTKAGAAPHLYTHRGDAVTGPIRWLPRDVSRGDRRDVARVWLTAPCRPIRCRFYRNRTTWLGVPSFFIAYEVSCRVRAERAMPYAPLERFTPGPCGPMWVPRPPAPPGGSALQHSVVNQLYTPRTVRCQHLHPADYF
jgi:hypothetical protein